MPTSLTFGTISALFGLAHGVIDRGQYSYLVAKVIASTVAPTVIANTFFLPRHLLPRGRKSRQKGKERRGMAQYGRLTPTRGVSYTGYMRVVLLLSVWFFVWGICPWNDSSASAAPYHAAHDRHGHSTSDSHHASKGEEHGCSGSISYKKSFECEPPAVSPDLPTPAPAALPIPLASFGSAPDRPALYSILRN